MPESMITKHALAGALKGLMTKHPLEKITVGDICAVCGMSRKGFYYHFKDKYDLVNWIFYTEFVLRIYEQEYESEWEFYEDICAYFYENRGFYINAFEVEGQNSFSDYFCEIIHPLAQERFQLAFGDGLDHGFYATFCTDAFRIALVRWLREQPEIGPHEFVSLIKRGVLAIAHEYRDAPPEGDDQEAGEHKTL